MNFKRLGRHLFNLKSLLGCAPLFIGASPLWAQSAPPVGDAESFAVLGGSTVTVAGTGTVITGDVGVSPGTSITGIPAGGTVVAPFTTHSSDAAAIAAQAASTALYTTLASTGSARPLSMELGGVTLNPGTYSFSSSANIAAGTTLILDGEGLYIFKVGSALTANVQSNVLMRNGASPSQVFWQITSAATLNGVTFSGTVVAQAAITLGVGATLYGRALTTAAGAVTMAGSNTINGGGDLDLTPTLGDAEGYGVLAGFAVTAAGTGTIIRGDVGVSPGMSIVGIPGSATVEAPFGTHINDAEAIAAQVSTTALYATLAGRRGFTALGAELGGLTLSPGTYSFSNVANLAAGTTLALDGEGLYVFQVRSSLTAGALSNVLLLNGASQEQVFWQVPNAATLNGTTFFGIVVAQLDITMGDGATLNGGALTTVGGVVTMLGNNTINTGDAPLGDPVLGDAESFGVLAGSAVTALGTGTVIWGDVGVAPGVSIVGIPGAATVVPPFGIHINDAEAIAGRVSTTELYAALVGREGARVLGPDLGGLTLTPGTYSFSGAVSLAPGATLTLDGNGLYVFQIPTTLTADALSRVVLANGASEDEVFWQVTEVATLNGLTFYGSVVAQFRITLGVGATLNGRALTADTGVVTMRGNNTINTGDVPVPETYCTGKVNSLGCTPSIATEGVSSATLGSGFTISCTELINNKFGMLLYSDQGRDSSPFFGGTLCVSGPMSRSAVVSSGGNPPPSDCSGEYSLDMNAFAVGALSGNPASFLTVPGTVVAAQWWSRDNGFSNPDNIALSNAVEFTVGL